MTDAAGYDALTSAAAAYATASLGQFEVSGLDAHAFVNRACTVDISALPPGRFADALMLRDDASILGRLTVYRFADLVMLLVDGDFHRAAWTYLVERKRGNVRLRDISDEVAVVAVRGPAAAGRLATLLEPVPESPGDLRRARLAGVDVFAARATLDGPDGVDCYCRSRDLESLRSSIGRLGIPFIDAATWNMIRLEWGMARVGIEIDPQDTPLEAGLDALVAQGKGAPFPGEVALANRRRSGPFKVLTGFTVAGHEAPPAGSEVQLNGRTVDRVRSSGVSPRAGVIGLTAVPQGSDASGTPIRIVAADRHWDGTLARPPFVERQR
jgi:glycine cleavage system aminomethyltransferase T